MKLTIPARKYFFLGLAGLLFLLGGQGVLAQDKIEIDFFYSKTCPHCVQEKAFLEELKEKYPEIELKELGIFEKENIELLGRKYEEYNVPLEEHGSVPIIFIGSRYFFGYENEQTTGRVIESHIKALINGNKPVVPEPDNKINVPFF